MKIALACLALAGALTLTGVPRVAFAQSQRTFVSGVGDDANSCTRTAPCKTFAGAYSKTSSGGTINCLDFSSYGQVKIERALTIDCSATRGAVTVLSGGSLLGIWVTNAASGSVTLRGLDIDGAGVANAGIYYVSDGRLSVDDVTVRGVNTAAMVVAAGFGAHVNVTDSVFSENQGGGILATSNYGNLLLSLTGVQSAHNTYGLRIEDNVRAVINHSSFVDNTNNGLLVNTSSAASIAWVSNSAFSNNGVNGIATNGARANVRLTGSTVVGNQNGLNFSGGGSIISTTPASNAIYGNPNMNAPSGSIALQ